MNSLHENIAEILTVTKKLGIAHCTPIVLSDAGNLILHLAPHPIVARMAKLISGDSECLRKVLARELSVVQHLLQCGVPAVPYSTIVPPGPYQVGDSWMTLWEYTAPAPLTMPDEEHVLDMIQLLTQAMAAYKQPLPALGAWKNAELNAGLLCQNAANDDRVEKMLVAFEQVDDRIRALPLLFPAHGDAHPRNLLPSADGWLWNDFEDVSLMPQFWDLASYIGNTALFHGVKHKIVDYVLNNVITTGDKATFLLVLKARALYGTITNLAMARGGNGDLEFAISQLEHINAFLQSVDTFIENL